ncbi:MAG: hypothetical protein HZR80_18675 [Candidatus Heimdallarchaeota archaeon]
MSTGEIQRANQLRKEGQFQKAKEIYATFWENSKDPFIGAGYLHCLRKLKETEKSVKFAYELKEYDFNNNWVNLEILWTLISGELKNCEDYSKAKELSNYLLSLLSSEPNDLASKIICEKMVKLAMDKENWKEGIQWLDRFGKENLTDEIVGQSEWTMKTLWYYRKTKCLFETGEYEKSINLINEINYITKPWNIQKQFLRIKAKTLSEMNELEESLKLYDKLSQGRADWWILHEKAIILKNLAKKEEALKVLYTVASNYKQLDKLVTLFNDIGNLCLELKKDEEALAHFILEKLVREKNNWSIESSLESQIDSLIPSFPNYQKLVNVKDALVVCKNFWKQSGIQPTITDSKHDIHRLSRKDDRTTRIGLQGIVQRKPDSNYFFIKMESESIICFLSDLTEEFQHRDKVIFDAQPSFDKKKNRKSWKAVNLKKID